ncbi:outer membrane protein [Pseudorhizobium tarimense]|uniref:Outer membrane protein n=1 Tax=Pseudorhizobium tarimense TaxID=1079109 RepID=A0ABV2HCQ8_9HYPH
MKSNSVRLAGLPAGLAMLGATAAGAAELAPITEAPVADVPPASSPWQIRVRCVGVITEDDGSVNGVPGSNLSYSDSVIPELDISYYFTDNIAAELILGTTYANIEEDGAVGVPVGRAWLLPPTLPLEYHFAAFGAFKPFVGAGVTYSMFHNQNEKPGFHDLDVDNAFGVALQAGFDYMLDEH